MRDHDASANTQDELVHESNLILVGISCGAAGVVRIERHGSNTSINGRFELCVIEPITITPACNKLEDFGAAESFAALGEVHVICNVLPIITVKFAFACPQLKLLEELDRILIGNVIADSFGALDPIEEEDVCEFRVGLDATQLPLGWVLE
jgi:hypothetical protein